MKKGTILVLVSLSLLLVGCQSNETNNNSVENSSEGTLPLVETNYGSGAESDGADTNANGEATRVLSENATSIIIYFSRTGNSENLARAIHDENGSDILELAVTNPYPADYEETVSRANEERENQEYPEISTDIPELSQYDTIYLGYQNWSMTLSNPIVSFLQDYGEALEGKTIFPFSTNAGYGEGNSLDRIAELAPDAVIAESFSIQNEELKENQDKVIDWLNQN